MTNVFNITINDSLHSFDLSSTEAAWISPDTSLATFIRTKTNYRGTKVSCAEGGCGACTVALTKFDASIGALKTRPANACLAKLLSLNGASVVTNDFIGNKVVGYHPIQEKLAELNGTQCGYCASGMVMLLYCFLKENPNATKLELEHCLDGNLCRCTGYRPILDTFKSFAASTDFTEEKACRKANCCQKQQKHLFDLEECHKAADASPPRSRIMKVHHTAAPNKNGVPAAAAAAAAAAPPPSYHDATSTSTTQQRMKATATTTSIWQDCNTLAELTYWMQHYSDLQVMLAVGSTSLAIFPMEYDVYLNIGAIPDLNVLSQSETGVTIGACNPVKNVIDYLSSVSTTVAFQTQNFPAVLAHLNRLAGYSLRCRASIGGNLMITHQHQQPLDFFPSDAAVVLLGLNATVSVLDVTTGATSTVSMSNFFSMDFTQRVLVSIFIPFATNQFQKFGSYKIAKRQVMSHAFVNCAFQATVSPLSNTIANPVVAIGGIYTCPTRVAAVETALTGLNVTSLPAVQSVCTQLFNILTQNVAPQGGRQQFRVQTAVNYLYKFLLSLQPEVPSNLSKATSNWLVRGVTSASQTFGTDPQQYPVSQPLNKVDGLTQTSGEAQYTADVPAPHGLLHAAVVQTTVANATISFINKAAANSINGFVKYYDATSIPSSRNTFGVAPLFATTTSNYAGQCVGFVVAKSRDIALACAAVIQETIEYTNQQTPILTVQQAVAANTAFPGVVVPPVTQGNVTTGFAQSARVVSGTVQIGSQYHIHLENNATIVQPVEGMYQVTAASQSPVNVQNIVANVLGIPSALVQVATRRCGGAFGAKQTNSNYITAMAAIAAQDLQLPVSLELTLQDPLRGLGARPLYLYNYKMGVDANNNIVAFEGNCAMSCGFTSPDCYAEGTTCVGNLDNCYNIPNFSVSLTMYQTNIAPGTSVRGPGWIQAIVLMEMCISDAARQLSVDANTLRQTNFYKKGDTLPTGMPLVECNLERVWTTLQASSELQQRQAAVATFNANNKFIKRGISINPCRFGVDWSWPNYNASVAIYSDGSIAISHGGVEVGQGINTKISQVCAFKFGLTAANMPSIRVLTTSTRCGPSMTNVTGGSVTSELCSLAVIHCCEILMQRLQPFLKQFPNWTAAVAAASDANVDLFASSCSAQPMPPYSRYNTWGASVSEVEVDALTGQFEVKRTDLVYDCGISLNPYVDIGQVEGGFTFGLGWFTVESVEWDPSTGQALDASTWEYKPPTAFEIPETLNVTLLENSYNTSGVLSSKASGEPPVALSVSVVQALESAINAARSDSGLAPVTVSSLPLPVDAIANLCGVTVADYLL